MRWNLEAGRFFPIIRIRTTRQHRSVESGRYRTLTTGIVIHHQMKAFGGEVLSP
jgi:hypothetical protein